MGLYVLGQEDPKKTKSGTMPFSAFTKQLPQDKRPGFLELMKKMRLTKQMPKDQKKGSIQQLDAEIHKLLGDDYKNYRSIAEKSRANKQGKRDILQPPPPPPPILKKTPPLLKKKKKIKQTSLIR